MLVALVLLLLPVGVARGEGTGLSVPGDMDGSGEVDAGDAAAMLRLLDGNGQADAALSGDVTQNGTVDGTDVLAALWMAAGKIADSVKFVERVSTGLLPETAFSRFCYDGSSVLTGGAYQNDTVSITISSGRAYDSTYYLADIYLQDIRCLKAGYGGDGVFLSDARVPELAAAYDALVAVNGDYYTQRAYGPIIRNGHTITGSVSPEPDLCVIGWDGVMTTFAHNTLDKATLAALDPYQTFAFGPRLLDESGHARSNFSSNISGVNPRTVLGYYSPGHYAFLVIDGRQGSYSAGMSLSDTAAFAEELGFAAAYNLDGGRSSAMASRDGLINKPSQNGRVVSDILYISASPENR